MIKAVFFDLDGVLVDSERMHQRLFEEFLEEIHSPIPPQRFYKLIGSHRSMNMWPEILEGIDIGMSAEEFEKMFEKAHRSKVKDVDFKTLVFDEVKPVLEELKKRGIFTAVASSSNINYIEKVLKAGDILDLFDLVATCDDFTKCKPDPEIYLYCLNHFRLSKDECLVVEDSPMGISAGKNAGLKVAARKDTTFGLDQSKADVLIDDLRGLLELL